PPELYTLSLHDALPISLPDAIAMPRTCRQTSGFDWRINDPERVRRNRCADRSGAANPQRETALDPIRRESRGRSTANREYSGSRSEELTSELQSRVDLV